MSDGPLRLVVAVLVLFLLLRAASGAWRFRALAVSVWRGVRWRHVVGAFALLVVVASLGSVLLAVPVLQVGLGTVVGNVGNAVFTPLEEAAVRAGPPPETGPDWVFIGLSTVFLGFLAALLPWLAFVEEEVFRAGLEAASPIEEGWQALKFGLVHMVMLVPLGAALAIAVAGFVYGRIYRNAYHRGRRPPPAAASAYRPSRRARQSARIARLRSLVEEPTSGLALLTAPAPEERQAAGVHASTVWHTTFNTMVVALLWAAIVWESWS